MNAASPLPNATVAQAVNAAASAQGTLRDIPDRVRADAARLIAAQIKGGQDALAAMIVR